MEFTTRDRHLEAPLHLPKRLVSTPSPRTCSIPESHSGASEVIQHLLEMPLCKVWSLPSRHSQSTERTHNQHNALCKCRGRGADPGPERQFLLNLPGRPGVEERSPGSPGGRLRSAHEASGPGRAPHSQEVAQAGLCPGDDAREAGARRQKDVRGTHGAQEREAKEGPHQGYD